MTDSNDNNAEKPMQENSAPAPASCEDYVRWAYRLLLGREPESLAAVQDNAFKNNRAELLKYFLNSAEFQTKYKHFLALSVDHPYDTWNRNAVAFVHLQKTGGTTLHTLLSAFFPQGSICPLQTGAFHLCSAAELARYDFYSGHFDYFSVGFIPRRHIRIVSIFRDPSERLLSFYRFNKSHAPKSGVGENVYTALAKKLNAEEFFEHEHIRSDPCLNNAYLFCFGSSFHDRATLNTLADDDSCAPILACAKQAIAGLGAIGLTERFNDSVKAIFTALGLPIPQSISPVNVTDRLPDTGEHYSRVPPVTMTARLSRALDPLIKYDRILYEAAKHEFDRRCAAPGAVEAPAPAKAI